MDKLDLGSYQFKFVCDITPDKFNGRVKVYLPQTEYENSESLPLHKYGEGPFCRFSIPNGIRSTGVYIIRVNDEVRYVGECENLSSRFNTGYGNISPRNCFTGGQPTNCRINHLIYQRAVLGDSITLFFHETDKRFDVERELIKALKPQWNISRGKSAGGRRVVQQKTRKVVGEHTRTTCREEILLAVHDILKMKQGVNQFTVSEVVDYMLAKGTSYKESTIRTHITSKCCINAPTNHATVYNDFKRIDSGVYSLVNKD